MLLNVSCTNSKQSDTSSKTTKIKVNDQREEKGKNVKIIQYKGNVSEMVIEGGKYTVTDKKRNITKVFKNYSESKYLNVPGNKIREDKVSIITILDGGNYLTEDKLYRKAEEIIDMANGGRWLDSNAVFGVYSGVDELFHFNSDGLSSYRNAYTFLKNKNYIVFLEFSSTSEESADCFFAIYDLQGECVFNNSAPIDNQNIKMSENQRYIASPYRKDLPYGDEEVGRVIVIVDTEKLEEKKFKYPNIIKEEDLKKIGWGSGHIKILSVSNDGKIKVNFYNDIVDIDIEKLKNNSNK